MLTAPIIIVLLISLGAIALFVSEKLPVDVTSLLVAVLLMLFGIVTPAEGLSGFSHVGTISVFCLMVLSLGLESTGAVNFLVNFLENRAASKSEVVNLLLISFLAGITSAFLNNTAIVAIMMPIVIRLSTITNISPSKLLMPLSFAAMAGGAITIIGTSTNVIVSSLYAERFGRTFGIFEFSVLGIILFFVYVIYILTIGRHLLPSNTKQGTLTQAYELDKYLTQVVVLPNSPLIGQKIGKDFHPKYGIRVLEIIRKDGAVYIPQQIEQIKEGDVMYIKTTVLSMVEMSSKLKLEIHRDEQLDDNKLTSEHAVLFEAVIGNNSYLLGKKIKEVDFRQMFNAVPLAVHRSGEALPTKVSEVKIKFGDTILMEARRKNLNSFYNSRDFIVLEKIKKPNFRQKHLLVSALIVVAVIVAAATKLLPLEVAGLTGVVAMFITGCASPRYVYRKLEWRIIFLLAGMIPLGIAVEKSGLSELIVNLMMTQFGDLSPTFIISGLFAVTVLLTSFMSNNATALLIAPIAMSLAEKTGLDPKPFLVAVMFAASTSFLTPIGYQTNTLVYGPGKYRFSDYLKVGTLLTVLFWLIATFLIPKLYF